MKFLIDTNILLPMEPGTPLDMEASTPSALHLSRLIASCKGSIWIHPASIYDIHRDTNVQRRKLRETLLCRYNQLESPPPVSLLDPTFVGSPPELSNDWVDNNLLAATYGNAVDYFVTEDEKLHKKARRIGINNRVIYLQDAIDLLIALSGTPVRPPHAVEDVFLYQIDAKDPFFDSLRSDYCEFDTWFDKCQREHRKAFIVRNPDDGGLSAICVYKKEDDLNFLNKINADSHNTLKMCTFKVASSYSGSRYGELLLKAVIEYARMNLFELIYFTVYPKHGGLISFAEEFGFREQGSQGDEWIYTKVLNPSQNDILSLPPFDINFRYGPGTTSFQGNANFIVPIRPHYHNMLFPDLNQQPSLFPDTVPCGNSIKKAYICNSNQKSIIRGDHLFFYRSGSGQAITTLGIVEDALGSQILDEVVQFVGTRTVYSINQIRELCNHTTTLTINFRWVLYLRPAIPKDDLINARALSAAPQSISRLSDEAIRWIRQKTGI